MHQRSYYCVSALLAGAVRSTTGMFTNLIQLHRGLHRAAILSDRQQTSAPNDDCLHPATQLEDVYAEIYRVLKPGALFASYEWVATAKFDAVNPDHVRIMDDINYGNGLPVRRRRGDPLRCIMLQRKFSLV